MRFLLYNQRNFKIYGRYGTLGDAVRHMIIKSKYSTIEFEVDDMFAYGVTTEEEWKMCKLLGMTTDHVVRL